MADERELIAEREKKVAELRALGVNPYANGFTPTHTTAEIVARFKDAPPGDGDSSGRFTVAGRIVAFRSMGKMAFVKILDRTGEIQVWVRKDVVGDAAYEIWKKVERGDFIGATGPATLTKTGEL